MKQRRPVLTKLKNSGVIGENYKGYIEYRTKKREQTVLVRAENQDRAEVYAQVARKNGTTTALVGKEYAEQIAEEGKKGQWFQRENGNWYQKYK